MNNQLICNPLSNEPNGRPDPFMMWHEGWYYLVCTERDRIVIHRSRKADKIFEEESHTVYIAGNEVTGCIWAPEMHFINGKWYIYSSGVTVGEDWKTIRMFCLEAVGDGPYCDYIFKGFTDPDIYAIDQTIFYSEKLNKYYNVFVQIRKETGNTIMIGELNKPWEIGENRTILKSVEFAWEKQKGRVTEGPFFFSHDGRTFMLYSANDTFSPYYCLGIMELIGDDPMDLNSWKKYEYPFFTGGNDVYSVGHASVFKSPNGEEYWLCYHGNLTPQSHDRNLYIQKFTFDEQGLPFFDKPIKRGEKFPCPAE